MLPIFYAAVIFAVIAVGGLLALRRLTTRAATRAIGFVVLGYVAFRVTFWLWRRWDLDPVELGYAWAFALMVIALMETVRFWRRKRTVA